MLRLILHCLIPLCIVHRRYSYCAMNLLPRLSSQIPGLRHVVCDLRISARAVGRETHHGFCATSSSIAAAKPSAARQSRHQQQTHRSSRDAGTPR